MKDSACILDTGATLGQDPLARQLANPRYNILGTRRRAVLGCANGALLRLCCAVGMQCDPRSLGNLLFQPSMLIHELLFVKNTRFPLFPTPLSLEKGPPLPDFPSASVESERSSASLTPSTSDPSAPSQLHPTRAKALWAHSARIGQSSSAVQSPAAAASGDHYCPCP